MTAPVWKWGRARGASGEGYGGKVRVEMEMDAVWRRERDSASWRVVGEMGMAGSEIARAGGEGEGDGEEEHEAEEMEMGGPRGGRGGNEEVAGGGGGEGGGWLGVQGRSSLSLSDSLGWFGADLTSCICETGLESSVNMRDVPGRTDSVERPRLGTGIARFIRGSIGCAGGESIVSLRRGDGVGAFLGLTGSLAARGAPLPATGPAD